MSSDELTKLLEELLRRSALLETGIENLGKRVEALENDSTAKIIALIEEVRKDLLYQMESLRKEHLQSSDELKDSIKVLSKKVDIMNRELLEVKVDNARLNDRMDALDKQPV